MSGFILARVVPSFLQPITKSLKRHLWVGQVITIAALIAMIVLADWPRPCIWLHLVPSINMKFSRWKMIPKKSPWSALIRAPLNPKSKSISPPTLEANRQCFRKSFSHREEQHSRSNKMWNQCKILRFAKLSRPKNKVFNHNWASYLKMGRSQWLAETKKILVKTQTTCHLWHKKELSAVLKQLR